MEERPKFRVAISAPLPVMLLMSGSRLIFTRLMVRLRVAVLKMLLLKSLAATLTGPDGMTTPLRNGKVFGEYPAGAGDE